MDRALRRLIEAGEPYNIEFKIKQLGTGNIIDIHSIAEYDKEKNIVFGVIQDITERKRMEEDLLRGQKLESLASLAGCMCGLEAVAHIRKIDQTVPVFVASGYAENLVLKNPKEYGFTASISKPFTIAELSKMLNAHSKRQT